MLCNNLNIAFLLGSIIIDLISPANAYLLDGLFQKGKISPALVRFQNDALTTTLKIRLDIGESQEQKSPRLGVSDLLVELKQEQKEEETTAKKNIKKKNLVTLPGSGGPNPHLSTGPNALNVVSTGTYVTLGGVKSMPFTAETASYEMVWRDEAPAGMLICGFDLPTCVSKNNNQDVAVRDGRVYMSFPIWDKSGLAYRRKVNSKIEKEAKEAKDEYESELKKYSETNNILMKALHFRNACAAHEKYDFSGIRSMQQVPDDTELMTLPMRNIISDYEELFLCTKGTVWRKDEASFVLSGKSHHLLGSALITPP